jgi:hypothetical protein
VRCAELLLAGAGLLLPACIFFSDFDGLADGPAHDAGGDAPDAPACSGAQFKLCTAVPRAPEGFEQLVDGLVSDFCQLPATVFQPKLGSFQTCGAEASFIDSAEASLTARVAWSEAGLHFFGQFRKDPSIPIVVDPVQLYKGDAIEILFANRAAPTGDPITDQALHLIIAPPEQDGSAGHLSSSMLFDEPWMAVRTSGGFDVELVIPWSLLGGPAPETDNGVVLNLGLDITGPSGERYQSFLHYTPQDGASSQFCKDTSKVTPAESTLTWCASKLF